MGNQTSQSSSYSLNKSGHGFSLLGKHTSKRDKKGAIPTGAESTKNNYPEFLIKLAYILEEKSLKEEDKNGICESVFQKYLCKASKAVGNQLFAYFKLLESKDNTDNAKETLSSEQFERQANDLLGCLTDTQQIEYYIKVFALDADEITSKNFYDLIAASYEIAQFAHHSSVLPDELLSAITKATMHGKEQVSRKYAFNWLCQHCPRIVMWMHRYICHTLTVGYSTIPQNVDTEEEDNETPVLDCPNNSSCANLHPALVWLLSCSLPTIYSKSPQATPSIPLANMTDPHKYIKQQMLADAPNHWVPLYNSDNHGLSVNRFQHHVFDYHGPTLLFITTEDKDLFCVAADEEWRDSKHFFGGIYSFCFQLLPEYKIIEKGAKMLYFNQTSRGFPLGIQVGTDVASANKALTIDGNMSLVHYKKIPYRLRSLEVWGCGSTYIREKQDEYKRVANKDVESRRKVKIDAIEWADNPDRYLLELGGKRRPSYVEY